MVRILYLTIPSSIPETPKNRKAIIRRKEAVFTPDDQKRRQGDLL
jgi:hypothetical protein